MGFFAKLGRGMQRLVGVNPTVTDEAKEKLNELRHFLHVLNKSWGGLQLEQVKGVFDFTWVTNLSEDDQQAFYQRWLTIERRMNEQFKLQRKEHAVKPRSSEQLKIGEEMDEATQIKLLEELQNLKDIYYAKGKAPGKLDKAKAFASKQVLRVKTADTIGEAATMIDLYRRKAEAFKTAPGETRDKVVGGALIAGEIVAAGVSVGKDIAICVTTLSPAHLFSVVKGGLGLIGKLGGVIWGLVELGTKGKHDFRSIQQRIDDKLGLSARVERVKDTKGAMDYGVNKLGTQTKNLAQMNERERAAYEEVAKKHLDECRQDVAAFEHWYWEYATQVEEADAQARDIERFKAAVEGYIGDLEADARINPTPGNGAAARQGLRTMAEEMQKEADSVKASAGMIRTISQDLKIEINRIRDKIAEFGKKMDTARAISRTEWSSAAAGQASKLTIAQQAAEAARARQKTA